jgi:hypothetical protein
MTNILAPRIKVVICGADEVREIFETAQRESDKDLRMSVKADELGSALVGAHGEMA